MLLPARRPRTASQLARAPMAGASWKSRATAERVSRVNRYLRAYPLFSGWLVRRHPLLRRRRKRLHRVPTDGGQSWNIQSQSGVDLYTVACQSDDACVSSGFNGNGDSNQSYFYTANGGTTWTMTSPSPAGIGTFMTCLTSSVSPWDPVCPRRSTAGRRGHSYHRLGRTHCSIRLTVSPRRLPVSLWGRNSERPATTDIARGVGHLDRWRFGLDKFHCPACEHCFHQPGGVRVFNHMLRDRLRHHERGSVGDVMTTNAGTSWTSVTGPSGFVYPSSSFGQIAMACTSASTCIIVGTGRSGPISSVSTNSGGSWTSSPSGSRGSCRTNSSATPRQTVVAVDGKGFASLSRGQVIHAPSRLNRLQINSAIPHCVPMRREPSADRTTLRWEFRKVPPSYVAWSRSRPPQSCGQHSASSSPFGLSNLAEALLKLPLRTEAIRTSPSLWRG